MQRTVRVEATGEVEVLPDRAVVDVAVETRAETAEEAAAENARRTTNLLSALRDLGLPDDAVETRQFSVQPEYARPRTEGPPRVEGYRAVNTIGVRVDELDALGSIIDGAVAGGADRVTRLQFELSDPLAARRAALTRAVANATSDADAIAEALGMNLGPVIEASTPETAPGFPVMRMALQADGRAETPIAPGPQTVTASVRLVFSLSGGAGAR